jgi:hypothetical protein
MASSFLSAVLDSFVYIQRGDRAFSVAFFFPLVWPNATLQARPIAGARDERRLLGVACKRLFGAVSVEGTQVHTGTTPVFSLLPLHRERGALHGPAGGVRIFVFVDERATSATPQVIGIARRSGSPPPHDRRLPGRFPCCLGNRRRTWRGTYCRTANWLALIV